MKNLGRQFLSGVAFAVVSCAYAGMDYPFRAAEMTNVSVRSGFWLPRIETNRIVTIKSDFKRSEETGRIHNFEAAGRREGKGFKGIPYDDSDVFKIIEGASYVLATHPDSELDCYLDDLISKIAKAQEPDGYLYTARTLGHNSGTNANGSVNYGLMGPTRWSALVCSHELYNIGHMYEAAVAHYRATGKRSLLDVAVRSADLVERTFGFASTQLKVTLFTRRAIERTERKLNLLVAGRILKLR